ncbi:unnamed protein product, partial [Lampetra fluviatilis]
MDWTPSNVNGALEASGGGGDGDSLTTVSPPSPPSPPPPPSSSTAARRKLLALSKDQLVARVEELERKVAAMSEASTSRQADDGATVTRRPFDFSRHNRRHVLLKLAYLGWDYHGYAAQENTRNTVEEHLFEALDKTRLVESRQTANYHRCGRTDRGVSAIDQVVSITLRSNLAQGKGVIPTPNADVRPEATELRYAHILNKVLPRDIRVLCWAPVEAGFSARFDCARRRYRYWFPRGRLDVAAMREAARSLVGNHDFRNLCKMDVANGVVGFRRMVISADVRRAEGGDDGGDGGDEFEMMVFEVVGLAFLYHQVRCMMAVLLLVGEGLERPQVVSQLLDVERNPCKPQYSMASELPLEVVRWVYDEEASRCLRRQLQGERARSDVRTRIVASLLARVPAAVVAGNRLCLCVS